MGLALGVGACRLPVPIFDREMFRLPFVLTSRIPLAFAALVTIGGAILREDSRFAGSRVSTSVAALKSRE